MIEISPNLYDFDIKYPLFVLEYATMIDIWIII
jgi:hypothetical protein